jgi:hypothetical protein
MGGFGELVCATELLALIEGAQPPTTRPLTALGTTIAEVGVF